MMNFDFEPTEKDLNDLNALREKVGLPQIMRGQIKSNAAWQLACNEIDQLAEDEATDDSELAAECVQLKAKLMKAGLYKTAHQMEAVVTSVGWELAEKINVR